MRRREFITLLGGTAFAWPLYARAQQPDQIRRSGVLMTTPADDTVGQIRLRAFLRGLRELGWTEGRNARIDIRWVRGTPDDFRKYAAELMALAPDVILAPGSVSVEAFQKVTHTVPIVFVHVPDPVGAGFVQTLARPGGNATGLIQYEYSIGGKWLELLKQIAPSVTQAGVIRDARTSAGLGLFGAIQAVAPGVGVEVSPINMSDEIDRAITAFARSSNRGLIVTGSALAVVHRDQIIMLAAQHKLPSVYYERFFVAAGGLISYGPDIADQFHRAAAYVDRILKGEKPADLPVQQPTKFEFVINLKTAKTLGITVPPTLLARADEVIE
jgi:ABC-type uncharacterized transport system substrate-binding protein